MLAALDLTHNLSKLGSCGSHIHCQMLKARTAVLQTLIDCCREEARLCERHHTRRVIYCTLENKALELPLEIQCVVGHHSKLRVLRACQAVQRCVMFLPCQRAMRKTRFQDPP